jgi:hypothetical protein
MADEPHMVRNLDTRDGRDLRTMRRAVRRWGVDDDFKDEAIRALRYTLALEMAKDKPDARAVNGIIKTLTTMEGQNQADEHLEEKHARTDDGKPDAITEIRVTRAAKELPSGDD